MKYNGATLYKDIDFNLYGEEIDFEESKENILDAFKRDYEATIKESLSVAGLELKDLEYYGPKFYNFEGDSIDPEIEVKDAEMLDKYIALHTDGVQKLLDGNKSYDGYMALTPDTVSEITHKDLITVIQYIFNGIDFEDFDIYDYMIKDWDDEEEGEEEALTDNTK